MGCSPQREVIQEPAKAMYGERQGRGSAFVLSKRLEVIACEHLHMCG